MADEIVSAEGVSTPSAEPAPISDTSALADSAVSQLSAEELSAPLDFEGEGATPSTPATAKAPADPNVPGSAKAPAAPATPAGWQSVREAAQVHGVDLSRFQDDQSALAHLAQQYQLARQNDYYTQLGRQLAPQHQQIAAYIAQEKAKVAQPTERKIWEAPEFDQRWAAMVDVNPETGAYTAKPGVDPTIAEKTAKYAEWFNDYQRNPQKYIGPMVDERAQTIAQQMVDQRFAQLAEQQQIQQIVNTNASWLYAADAQGNRVTGADGKFMASPLGARYMSHLQTLKAGGVTNTQTLDRLAQQLLQADIATQQTTATAQQAQAARPQVAGAITAPNRNPLQAVPVTRTAAVPGAVESDDTGLSLHEVMMREMRAAGVVDTDFAFGS